MRSKIELLNLLLVEMSKEENVDCGMCRIIIRLGIYDIISFEEEMYLGHIMDDNRPKDCYGTYYFPRDSEGHKKRIEFIESLIIKYS